MPGPSSKTTGAQPTGNRGKGVRFFFTEAPEEEVVSHDSTIAQRNAVAQFPMYEEGFAAELPTTVTEQVTTRASKESYL